MCPNCDEYSWSCTPRYGDKGNLTSTELERMTDKELLHVFLALLIARKDDLERGTVTAAILLLQED